MTYPNVDEVWWCDLGEGVALAVIGIAPEHRLTLETNTGYLLIANGVPIGYGGVTPLFRQANTGINIFDPFRGGEAAYLWTQMLRAFHTLYGSERFVINAYQFGAGNAEAIRSGAFWFYYRLGFRPAQRADGDARGARGERASRPIAVPQRRAHAARARHRATSISTCATTIRADYFDEALLPHGGALAARLLAREASLAGRRRRGAWPRRGLRPRARRLRALAVERAATASSSWHRWAGVPGDLRDWSDASATRWPRCCARRARRRNVTSP